LFDSSYENEFNRAAENFNPSIRDAITLKQLMSASMHIGHVTSLYHRSMGNYILGEREGIHIIDLEKTLAALRRAILVVKQTAKHGGRILFVGSRPLIRRLVYECAVKADQYYVNDNWKKGNLIRRN
jgi:small subunit ribosomal protein S2